MRLQKFTFEVKVDFERELNLMLDQINKYHSETLGGRFTYNIGVGMLNEFLPLDHDMADYIERPYGVLYFQGNPALVVFGDKYVATDATPERSGTINHLMIFYLITNMIVYGVYEIRNRAINRGNPITLKIKNPSKL